MAKACQVTKKRLYLAWLCYAILAAVAGLALGGRLRIAIWILLSGLAVKSWIAERDERIARQDARRTPVNDA